MPLFLLRHGETEFNVAGRFQGQNNSPLTPRGKHQAQANGLALKDLIVDKPGTRIIASPLQRTLETAQIICQAMGLDSQRIKQDGRLKEIHFGAWQGLTKQEINREYPNQWKLRNADPANFVIPGGGENYHDMFIRVDDFLTETRQFWNNETPWIVISHGTTGSILRGRYLGLDLAQIRQLKRPHDRFYELLGGQIHTHQPAAS